MYVGIYCFEVNADAPCPFPVESITYEHAVVVLVNKTHDYEIVFMFKIDTMRKLVNFNCARRIFYEFEVRSIALLLLDKIDWRQPVLFKIANAPMWEWPPQTSEQSGSRGVGVLGLTRFERPR